MSTAKSIRTGIASNQIHIAHTTDTLDITYTELIIGLGTIELDKGVSNMSLTSKFVSEWLNALRIEEESSLSSTKFVASIAKGYRYSMLISCIVGIGMGYFLSVPVQDPSVGMIFGALGIAALFTLPTCFSYRCYVDRRIMKEAYYILCFPIRKEVLWTDVAYKRVRRDSKGNAYSIRLYDKNKKKLISFNHTIAGFGRIVRLAKSMSALK